MSNVNLSVVNNECFALVFTLCNPSDLMNTPYCITCALLFFGVGRLPCFCCAASLNTEWAFPLPFFCTVMILQIWLCWLLWTAVPDGTSNLLKIRKLIYYSPMDLCCYPFIQKAIFPPIGKPAAGMNDHVGGKNDGLNSLCMCACLCLCFRSLPEGLISPNISVLMSEGTHTFSLGYS